MSSDPESESELESESIRGPESETESELHHHDSAPMRRSVKVPSWLVAARLYLVMAPLLLLATEC